MKVRGLMIWVFLMCCFFGHIIETKSFSKFDDLEIEKRLKTINKPVVKIIKTIHGERYGCVDFFKQPAFDHPSMKNHTYHYKMRPIWNGMRERKTNKTGFGYLWENGEGCPIGTVPIRRVTKDDLLRLDSFGDDPKPHGSCNLTTTNDPNLDNGKYHYAVVRTNKPVTVTGATMDLCVTAPKVKPGQFSSTRFHIQIGNDYIQAGSTVYPSLYNDNQPRIYVFTHSGGKSCYNTRCDTGIIQVSHDIPLGMVLSPVSVRGSHTTHYGTYGVFKDKATGHWWFQFGNIPQEVGFWPSSRFKESVGNYVEWGGEVYSASLPSPEMGFGVLPERRWDKIASMRWDAYMKRISVYDQNYVKYQVNNLEEFADDTRGYKVIDSPMEGTSPGHLVFYGGPGGI